MNQIYHFKTGKGKQYTMRHFTIRMLSEKFVIRLFHCCANTIESTYTNLDGMAHYTPRLCGRAYKPVQHITVLHTVGDCNVAALWYYDGYDITRRQEFFSFITILGHHCHICDPGH